MSWQRARRPEQKQQREEAILAAAGELVLERGLEEVSLAAIAARATLSKANLYRYFESREDIVLQVLEADLADWTGELRNRFDGLSDSGDVDGVAHAFADTLTARPRLAELLSKSSGVLERNVSADRVAQFKTRVYGAMDAVGEAIVRALPTLGRERIPELFIHLQMLITGLWPAAFPNETVREVLTRPEFSAMRVDYQRDFKRMLATVLRGLIAAE